MRVMNQTKDSAEIYISGTIIDDEESNWKKFWNDGDTTGYQFPADLKQQLDALEDKDLTIYINSYGGSIAAGVAMAHMLERHKGKTTAIVDAYCCSIATQIFFSADVCKMPSNAWLMLHKPTALLGGDADEMRKAADVLDTLQEGLEVVYGKKAADGLTAEDIHEMVNAETWLTGKQAAEKFQIELLDSTPILNCVGNMEKLRAMGAKNIPPSLNFLPEDKSRPPQEDILKIEIALARAKGVI